MISEHVLQIEWLISCIDFLHWKKERRRFRVCNPASRWKQESMASEPREDESAVVVAKQAEAEPGGNKRQAREVYPSSSKRSEIQHSCFQKKKKKKTVGLQNN